MIDIQICKRTILHFHLWSRKFQMPKWFNSQRAIEWPHFPNKLPRVHKKVRLEFPRRKIETVLSLGTSTTLSQGNIHWSCKALKSSSLGCTMDERVTWFFHFSSLIFQLFIHPVVFHSLWKKLKSKFHPFCKFPLNNFLTSCNFSSIMQPFFPSLSFIV